MVDPEFYEQLVADGLVTEGQEVYVLPNTPPEGAMLRSVEVPGVGQLATAWVEIGHGAQTVKVTTVGVFLIMEGALPIYLFPAGGVVVKEYEGDRASIHAEREATALRYIQEHSGRLEGIPTLIRMYHYIDPPRSFIVTDGFPALPQQIVFDMRDAIIDYYDAHPPASPAELAALEKRFHLLRDMINLLVLYDGLEHAKDLSNFDLVHDDLVNSKNDGRGERKIGNILVDFVHGRAPWVDFGWLKEVVPGKLFSRSQADAFHLNAEDLLYELERLPMDKDVCKEMRRMLLSLRRNHDVEKVYANMRTYIEERIRNGYAIPEMEKFRELVARSTMSTIIWSQALQAKPHRVFLPALAVERVMQVYKDEFGG